MNIKTKFIEFINEDINRNILMNPLYDVSEMMGDEFYETPNEDNDKTIEIIKRVKHNPNEKVIVYKSLGKMPENIDEPDERFFNNVIDDFSSAKEKGINIIDFAQKSFRDYQNDAKKYYKDKSDMDILSHIGDFLSKTHVILGNVDKGLNKGDDVKLDKELFGENHFLTSYEVMIKEVFLNDNSLKNFTYIPF